MMRLMLLGFVCVAMSGCHGQQSTSTDAWAPLSEATMSAAQAAQKSKAIAARDALFERLMSRLSAVVQQDGAAAAIVVCQAEAPALANAVSREHGVSIGRTSDKRRNRSNQAPAWASATLAHRPTEPMFLAGPQGQLGAILPIRVKSQCLTCHGSPQEIPPAVQTNLAKLYPHDQATGYKEHDLRGWFWVEVPN